MTNEIVKHHNDLNTVIMRKWTAEEMNFFFAIIAKARDKGTRLMRFDTDELRNLASKDFHLERWSQTMKSVADKVVDLKYYERTEHSYAVMNLFSYFRVDEKERIVEVEVSSKFEYVVNNLPSMNLLNLQIFAQPMPKQLIGCLNSGAPKVNESL